MPASTDPALRERGGRPRWWLGILAPAVAALVVAHLLPGPAPTLLQRAAAFLGLKVGADALRGRAWPNRHRFLDDIAREWLTWLLVAAAYVLLAALALRAARPVPQPTWPALLAYWILWLP